MLPFLLIFTTIYAILEKSKVFGTEKIGDSEVSKKNLNSMFAFVTSFLVIASTRLVAAINEALANMTILLLLGVCFLLLIGVFHTGKDEVKLTGGYKSIFMVIMFVGILLIFLNAIKTKDGVPWLYFGWNFIVTNIDTGAMGAIILTVVIVLLMGYITKAPSEEKVDAKKKEE